MAGRMTVGERRQQHINELNEHIRRIHIEQAFGIPYRESHDPGGTVYEVRSMRKEAENGAA